jgi:hypothetical protein
MDQYGPTTGKADYEICRGDIRITANGWFVEAVGLLDVGKITPPIDLRGEKKNSRRLQPEKQHR